MLPTSPVHVATRSGVLGNGMPLASFGAQTPSLSLHHSLLAQSVSTRQPLLHNPLSGSHTLPT